MTEEYKTIVAGSRGILSYMEVVKAIEDAPWEISEVVCGGAVGPDSLGERWARVNGIPIKMMKADWNKHGSAAGPIRNAEMAKYADRAIVVWDGESPGSKNMIKEMNKLGKKTHVRVVI